MGVSKSEMMKVRKKPICLRAPKSPTIIERSVPVRIPKIMIPKVTISVKINIRLQIYEIIVEYAGFRYKKIYVDKAKTHKKANGMKKQTIGTSLSDPGGARTLDPLIKSQLLYQLSYGVGAIVLRKRLQSYVIIFKSQNFWRKKCQERKREKLTEP